MVDGNATGFEFVKLFIWQIHIYDAIIGIAFAFLIPVIYSRIQRGFKKLRLRKFWIIFSEELDMMKSRHSPVSVLPPTELPSFINRMKRIELLVADIFSEQQFHQYLAMIDYFEQVNSRSSDVVLVINLIKNYLKDLLLSNKPPRYLMWTAPKFWCRRSSSKI